MVMEIARIQIYANVPMDILEVTAALFAIVMEIISALAMLVLAMALVPMMINVTVPTDMVEQIVSSLIASEP